jgi:hypothetical protein
MNKIRAEHLFGILVLAMVAAILLGGRPKLPANTPRIHAIEQLPDDAKLAKVRRYTEYGSGILPYNRREQQDRAMRDWSDRQPLRVGYSYREISFFGLPVWAYPEYGLVTFIEVPAGYNMAILRPQQVELLQELTGRDYSDYSFPWWKHLWGWLFPIGFIAAALRLLQEDRRRREAEGVV